MPDWDTFVKVKYSPSRPFGEIQERDHLNTSSFTLYRAVSICFRQVITTTLVAGEFIPGLLRVITSSLPTRWGPGLDLTMDHVTSRAIMYFFPLNVGIKILHGQQLFHSTTKLKNGLMYTGPHCSFLERYSNYVFLCMCTIYCENFPVKSVTHSGPSTTPVSSLSV